MGAARTGCGGKVLPGPIRPDPRPYEVADTLYHRYDATRTAFNRARVRYAGAPGNYRGMIFRGMVARVLAADPAFTTADMALKQAADYVGRRFGFADSLFDYRLEREGYSFADAEPALPDGVPRTEFPDPSLAAIAVKRAARTLGADLVGVTELDQRWAYSRVWLDDVKRGEDLRLPDYCRWAVVMAVAMDYDSLSTVPAASSGVTTTLTYARSHVLVAALATFIKSLGYRAIACGNDTALSVPLAVDAGLGECSRSGLLVTPNYGPRVRLVKVLTDLPLKPDFPITFGVKEFCSLCGACATRCPAGAIQGGPPTWSGPSPFNNPGVKKWYVEPDRCFDYWLDSGAPCTACIALCPFNRREVGLPSPLPVDWT